MIFPASGNAATIVGLLVGVGDTATGEGVGDVVIGGVGDVVTGGVGDVVTGGVGNVVAGGVGDAVTTGGSIEET